MASKNKSSETLPDDSTNEPTEPTTERTAPATEPDPTLLTAFQEAVTTCVGQRDLTTGEVHVEIVAPTKLAFSKLDGTKQRNAAKSFLDESAKSAIMDQGDAQLAKSYMLIKDAVTSTPTASKKESAPVDPTEARSVSLATLTLAYGLANVADDLQEPALAKAADMVQSVSTESIDAYQAWLDTPKDTRGDAPDLPAFAVRAIKIANGKAAGTSRAVSADSYSGPRRSIAAHVTQAFSDLEPGTFLKISEIVNKTSDEYGEDSPSSGAVSGYLFAKDGSPRVHDTVTGVQDERGRGAVRN